MAVLAALMAVLAAVAVACWRSAERDRKALARRCRHLTQQSTGYRAEAVRLSAECAQLRTDVDLPRWGQRTLTEIWSAAGPDDFKQEGPR